jgi:hypothetical protein
MRNQHRQYWLLFGAAAASLIVPIVPGVASAGDRSVDPSTLTPPMPDFFGASCAVTGAQISCDLAFVDPVAPVEEPTGIMCDTGIDQFEILDTWTRSVVGKRIYSADGLLLRRHFRDRWQGTFTNAATGSTVGYEQRSTILHDLEVAGDNGTGLEQTTVRLRFVGGSGTVLMQAGRTVLSRDTDEIIASSGPHPFDDFFGGDASALQPLCDALS